MAASSIPVIDIDALYSDDPEAKKQVAAKLGAACDDIGFFYAVNHNVPVEVSDRAVAMVDRFFSLPEAERLKVKADKNNRGSHGHGRGQGVSLGVHGRFSGRCCESKV